MSRVVALVLFIVLVAGGVLAVPAARSASPDVVVSQVFAGRRQLRRDLHERLRRALQSRIDGGRHERLDDPVRVRVRHDVAGDRAVGVDRTRGGTTSSSSRRQPPSVRRCRRPTSTGTTNLAVSGGKVALVRDASPLTCGASAGSCSAVTSIADLVGYGTAADYEGGGAAPTLDNTTAAVRAGQRLHRHRRELGRLRRGRADAAELGRRGHVLRRRRRRRAAASRRAPPSTSTSSRCSRSRSSARRVSFGNADRRRDAGSPCPSG